MSDRCGADLSKADCPIGAGKYASPDPSSYPSCGVLSRSIDSCPPYSFLCDPIFSFDAVTRTWPPCRDILGLRYQLATADDLWLVLDVGVGAPIVGAQCEHSPRFPLGESGVCALRDTLFDAFGARSAVHVRLVAFDAPQPAGIARAANKSTQKPISEIDSETIAPRRPLTARSVQGQAYTSCLRFFFGFPFSSSLTDPVAAEDRFPPPFFTSPVSSPYGCPPSPFDSGK